MKDKIIEKLKEIVEFYGERLSANAVFLHIHNMGETPENCAKGERLRNELAALEQEENMECYPAEFVEWLAFKSHGNFNPRFELHKYWDGTVNEWRSVFRKLDGLIWEDITIAELYKFWKTEIDK